VQRKHAETLMRGLMLKRLIVWLSVPVMASLTSCAGSGPAAGNFCDIAKPIYFQDADQMTRETERAIIRLNEVGAKLCGWR